MRTVCSSRKLCGRCSADQDFLRTQTPPQLSQNGTVIRAADLYSGCGGMTLGLWEAARQLKFRLKVSLAVDSDPDGLRIYKANFRDANALAADVCDSFDGEIGAAFTASEQRIVKHLPEIDILCGGPPCQGHSDLNNHTRRDDPKNLLYLRLARATEVLLPKVVVVENVATVHLDRGKVVEMTREVLAASGYNVAAKIVDLRLLGVPQRRRRFILFGTNVPSLDPEKVLQDLNENRSAHPDRSVRWAIHDLLHMRRDTAFDSASTPTRDNATRIDSLFDQSIFDLPNELRPKCHREKDHSYVSVYGRLRWAKPAQTITTGFGCMGQGRYVHPQRRRTLTPHEAARLQTFPDWFEFGERTSRGTLAKVIGNAVPPLLMRELGLAVLPAIAAASAVQHEDRRKRA